jgi:peptidoglycan/LPS O-acetylase OafA/YrhL
MFLLSGGGHLRLSAWPAALPVCRWLGRLSYPCYILHLQILLLLNHWVDQVAPESITQRPLVHAALEFVLVLTLLGVVGPRLESFFMNWRAGILAKASPRSVRTA